MFCNLDINIAPETFFQFFLHLCDCRLSYSKASEPFVSDALTEVVNIPHGKVFIQEVPDLKTPHAFRLDRKPDLDNFACGEIYRLHIPSFHRQCLRKRCLGFPSYHSNVWFTSGDRYFTIKVDEVDAAFVGPNKDSVCRVSYVRQLDTKSTPSFISLHLPNTDGNERGISRSEANGSSFDSEAEVQPLSRFRQKVAEYNRKLTSDPNDVETWLEFASFQSTECDEEGSLMKGLTADCAAAVIAEQKASVLDRAILSNPSSVKLKLAQLETCDRIWEADKLSNEWKKLIFAHPNDPTVWRHYLRHLRSTFGTFSTSRVLSAYARAISTLRALREGTMVTHQVVPNVTEHMIGEFLLSTYN